MAPQAGPLRAEAFTLFSQGQRIYEVASALGKPRSTIQSWYETWKQSGPETPQRYAPPNGQSQVTDLELEKRDMEIAALRQKLKIAEGTRPEVVPAYSAPPSQSPEARWKAAEIDNAEHIRKAMLSAHFSVELPGDKPVAFCFISDQHISIGNTVDLKRMREDAELIANADGAYAILGGDGIDNHIRHFAAILAARSQPSDQLDLLDWYLQIFASKVLAACLGNHDAWSNQYAGVDVVGRVFHGNRVHCVPDEAFISATLGSQVYRLAVRHQFRMNSTMNQNHAVKQYYRYGEFEWDIGCICHHHEPAIENFTAHGLDRWACRPGSYQVTSAYSRQYGFNKTSPTCPSFICYPTHREIIGFRDLRPALRFLKAERG